MLVAGATRPLALLRVRCESVKGRVAKQPEKSERKKAKTNRTFAHTSSTLSMAARNLINMVATTAVSGAVLLALLVARHF